MFISQVLSLLVLLSNICNSYPVWDIAIDEDFVPNMDQLGASFFQNIVTYDPMSSTNFIQLQNQIFNAITRARANPSSFANELSSFGDLKAAHRVGNMTRVLNAKSNYRPKSVSDEDMLLLIDQNDASLSGNYYPGAYGTWRVSIGSKIDHINSLFLSIIAILVKSPNHFSKIFSPSFNLLGVTCGNQVYYKVSCSMDFTVRADSFEDRDAINFV